MSDEKNKPDQVKLQKILNAIVRLAAGDYRINLPFKESDDSLDWIASGLNMLAQELRSTVVSRDYFNAIVSSMPDSLIVVNEAGVITLINDTTSRLLGYPREALVGLHFSKICPALYNGPAQSGAGGLSGPGMSEPLEVNYVAMNGKNIPVFFSASAMAAQPDGGQSWVCSAQDLRFRKALEDSLRLKDGLLAQSAKMASLGEMAAGIAHEINNPMAIITGRAEQLKDMMLETDFDREEFTKAVDRIETTARRVAKIITGLRTFARDAESDPFVTVPIRQVLDETLALCAERFRFNGVELICVGSLDSTMDFECRPVQVSQVLVNLLNNAYDAVQDGEEKWIRIEVKCGPDQIELSITDSGPGIPPALREKIMQPFYSTKAPGKGTGLGLSISSGIVRAHHGTLELDSASQRTRFVIRFPRRQAAMPKAA